MFYVKQLGSFLRMKIDRKLFLQFFLTWLGFLSWCRSQGSIVEKLQEAHRKPILGLLWQWKMIFSWQACRYRLNLHPLSFSTISVSSFSKAYFWKLRILDSDYLSLFADSEIMYTAKHFVRRKQTWERNTRRTVQGWGRQRFPLDVLTKRDPKPACR